MKLPLRHKVAKVLQELLYQRHTLGATLCLGALVAKKYFSEQTQSLKFNVITILPCTKALKAPLVGLGVKPLGGKPLWVRELG